MMQETADTTFGDDAAILAEMESLGDDLGGDEPEDSQDSEESAPEVDIDEAPADEEVTPDDETDAEKEPAAKDAPAEEPAPDDKLEKRLAAIQKEEERQKATVDAYRKEAEATIEKREAELAPKLEKLERFEAMESRAKYDLPGVLNALGITPDTYEDHAKLLYSLRPGAEQTSATREMAQRALMQRKQADELSEMRKELQELRESQAKRIEEEKQLQEQQRAQAGIDEYLDGVAKAANDSTPIASNLLAKEPRKARAELFAIADRMAGEYGEAPDPIDVLKRFETEKRAELELYGVDLSAIRANTKNQTQSAGETQTAKTLSNELGTPTRPRTEPKTEEELDQEILAELEKL